MRKAALVGEPLAIPLREATAPLVIAVDIGTSGLRSFLFDSRGRPIARAIAHRDRPLRVSNDGEATVDPDECVRATADAIDETVAAAGKRAADIAVVAVCAFWHAGMGAGAHGRLTTTVLTWADTRPRDCAAALRRELDPVATHARTGCTIHASYLPAKLRYLRDAAPDAFGRTAKWLSLGEYLYFRLFGGTRAAHGMASATGLYDQRKRTWDEPLLDRLRVPARSLATISDDPQSGLRDRRHRPVDPPRRDRTRDDRRRRSSRDPSLVGRRRGAPRHRPHHRDRRDLAPAPVARAALRRCARPSAGDECRRRRFGARGRDRRARASRARRRSRRGALACRTDLAASTRRAQKTRRGAGAPAPLRGGATKSSLRRSFC